jgi:hypothetical protein
LLASLACTACNCLMTSIHVYTFYHLPQHLILTYCNQYHTQFVSSGTTTTTKNWGKASCYNCHFKRTITPIILHYIVF